MGLRASACTATLRVTGGDPTLRDKTPRAVKRVARRLRDRIGNPQDKAGLRRGASPGDVAALFTEIRDIPGWFTLDDCSHFALALRMQDALAVAGDLLEIGSYHGRSAAVLARHVRPGQRLIVCDAFQHETEDPYDHRPTPQRLRANVRRVNPTLDDAQLEIFEGYSHDLRLDEGTRLRFAHVDGGHGREIVLGDLERLSPHVVRGGILVLDDVGHPSWPGVSAALAEFVARSDEFRVVADLNRHGAIGRKAYLVRP